MGDHFGFSVSLSGDVNEDGRADFIFGAKTAGSTGNTKGMAHVYYGRDGAQLYRKIGTAVNDEFGCSVSIAGDVNGDGKDDFITGQAWR